MKIHNALVLNWTTQEQVEVIAKRLETEMHLVLKNNPGLLDGPITDDWKFVMGVQNLLSDLEVPGYEMS